MKIQNIFRMQAIVIGLGAAVLLFPNSASAQEIVNTEFADGPNVTSFAQPTTAAISTASTPGAVVSNEASQAVAVSTPVITDEAMISFENSTERWLMASSILGLALLALYGLTEIRRSERNFPEGPSSPSQRRAALS